MDFTGRRHEAKPWNPRPEAEGGTTRATRQGVLRKPEGMQKKKRKAKKAKQRKERNAKDCKGKKVKEWKGKEGKERNGMEWNGMDGMDMNGMDMDPPEEPLPTLPTGPASCGRPRAGACIVRFGPSKSRRSAPFGSVQSALPPKKAPTVPFKVPLAPPGSPKGPRRDPKGR